MKIKQELYDVCQEHIDERLKSIKDSIREVQESLLSETKSSAGDKHETGRAMLQLEREKLGNQLLEVEKLKQKLTRIAIDIKSSKVGLGSVVYTTQFNYFVSLSIGKITVKDTIFYAISPETPMGQLLMGKQTGEQVAFNSITFKILKII